MTHQLIKVPERPMSLTLWTARNQCGDPFAPGILDPVSVAEGMDIICSFSPNAIEFSTHDDDMVPWDPNDPRDYLRPNAPIHAIIKMVKEKLDRAGMTCNMITCSLHGHPLFTNGGITNPNPAIRLLAGQKVLRALWIGNQLGAKYFTYWTARDGYEIAAAVLFKGMSKHGNGPYQWTVDGLNLIPRACKHFGYSIKGATIETKANEPRASQFLPLAGSALTVIDDLEDPEFFGLNPEVPQHSSMANMDPLLEIVLANEKGKLPFIHAGGQTAGRYDCDFPILFGTETKSTISLFYYLAKVGWEGAIEVDCHPMRSDCFPGAKSSFEIRKKFFRTNILMYRMIEQIIVPRIIGNTELAEAQETIWNPSYGGKVVIPETIEGIVNAKIDVEQIYSEPADCSRAEEEFNFSMFGTSRQEVIELLH